MTRFFVILAMVLAASFVVSFVVTAVPIRDEVNLAPIQQQQQYQSYQQQVYPQQQYQPYEPHQQYQVPPAQIQYSSNVYPNEPQHHQQQNLDGSIASAPSSLSYGQEQHQDEVEYRTDAASSEYDISYPEIFESPISDPFSSSRRRRLHPAESELKESIDRDEIDDQSPDSIPVGAAVLKDKPKKRTVDWRSKCGQRCEERNMDVTGVGVQSIATSLAEIRATIEYRRMLSNATLTAHLNGTMSDVELSSLISEVQTQISSRSSKVVEFLKKDPTVAPHITKLRTTSVTLEPMYEYQNNRMILIGYRATNSITFRTDIPMAGEIMDSIVERGVTRIDGVSFVALPAEINDARHTAIQSAVEDAIQQGMSALSGLSKVVGRRAPRRSEIQIIRLDIVGVTRPEPTQWNQGGGFMRQEQPIMQKQFASQDFSAIEGDEKTVSATVSLKLRF